jgi:hypothetical protein
MHAQLFASGVGDRGGTVVLAVTLLWLLVNGHMMAMICTPSSLSEHPSSPAPSASPAPPRPVPGCMHRCLRQVWVTGVGL